MAMSARGFVLKHTRLQPVPGLEGVRLHLADDVFTLWRAMQQATGDPDTPIPFWAFAWGGGLAIARYLGDHPDLVRGRRVLDVASGSGLCAIAAARAGATSVTAVDIDPYSIAAVGLNARGNGVRIEAERRDPLADGPPEDVDLILAGDCWYEEDFGSRMTAWLQAARARGIEVLIGDPGRRYLDPQLVRELATYEVRSTTDLEDMARNRASVYELRR
jgi:predicted nicotinamide N-methyase